MAELIENIDIHKIDIDNCTFCRPCDYHTYYLVPTRIRIPLFKDAIKIEFLTKPPRTGYPISCLQINEEENKILQFIFFDIEYIGNNIVTIQDHMYLLEKIHMILERRDEYVDVLYSFAGIREEYDEKDNRIFDVTIDQVVCNKLNIYSTEDIVDLYNTAMYELQIKNNIRDSSGDLSVCVGNIYIKPDVFEDLASFYIRVPMKIRELIHVEKISYGFSEGLPDFIGPNTVGKFMMCIDEDTWSVPFTDIDVEALKNSKNF